MDTDDSCIRLFYALWPDEATRLALAQLQAKLQGRKTALQNLHMTLAFLGSRPRRLLPVFEHIIMELDHPEMELHLDRVGYFEHTQIAWAGMSNVANSLMTLQQELMQRLAECNVSVNRQTRFKPHVTLAREELMAPTLTRIEPIRWRANRVALIESTLQDSGSSYRIIVSQRLEMG